jgi:hypothetical protein
MPARWVALTLKVEPFILTERVEARNNEKLMVIMNQTSGLHHIPS